ncbi:MAG: hypothetical protein OEZ06_27575 [Myxococcales bacterium]|nr:hypothetical protein [Myxococcales bacterium]
MHEPSRLPWVARLVGAVGERIIYALIRLFGCVVRLQDAPWLAGPIGSDYIGDRPYAELAQREGLEVIRDSREGGLLSSLEVLRGPDFDPACVDDRVRDFYENTARYELDARARSFLPLNVGVWLLVTTISRRVNQLTFPVDALESAAAMKSEIVLLRDGGGRTRYTGWSRRHTDGERVIYTGFYMTDRIPGCRSPVVKAVFPMPGGNATVFLRPAVNGQGQLELLSQGTRFGDPGFYRLDKLDEDTVRVWRVRTLVEYLRVFVDPDGELRCEHEVRFWGLPVLTLHYHLRRC